MKSSKQSVEEWLAAGNKLTVIPPNTSGLYKGLAKCKCGCGGNAIYHDMLKARNFRCGKNSQAVAQ